MSKPSDHLPQPRARETKAGYRDNPEVAKALRPTQSRIEASNRSRYWWALVAVTVGLAGTAAHLLLSGRSTSPSIEQRRGESASQAASNVGGDKTFSNQSPEIPRGPVPAAATSLPSISKLKCNIEARPGLRQQVISYESEDVVYAINGQARARMAQRGWLDGKDRFESKELLRLLEDGVKLCNSNSISLQPTIPESVSEPPPSPRRRVLAMSADAFTRAASEGDAKTIEAFLEAGFNVNARDRGVPSLGIKGGTAVGAAAASGHCEILDRLIAAGGKADFKELKFGFMPIVLAAEKGSVPCVKLLIAKGARVDVRTGPRGSTALILAAYQGHLDVARLLVDAGASLTVTNEDGDTAYKAARAFSNHLVSEYLQSKGGR